MNLKKYYFAGNRGQIEGQALVLLIEGDDRASSFWKGAEMVTKKDKLCETFRKKKRWLIVANDGSSFSSVES